MFTLSLVVDSVALS